MWGGLGMGRGGSKKYKPIPAPPYGAGLKSCPIPASSPLRGGENPHEAKREGAGQAGRGKIAIPKWVDRWYILLDKIGMPFSDKKSSTMPYFLN